MQRTQSIGRTVVVGVLALGGVMASACGSPDDDGKGGTKIPSEELCAAQFDALAKACPEDSGDRDANVMGCKESQHQYLGVGCQDQFDAWLQCTTTSGYDCAADTGCEVPRTAYARCNSAFTQRTGCSHLGSRDAELCTDPAKPFAFTCLAAPPATCVQVVTTGAGIWCCPQL